MTSPPVRRPAALSTPTIITSPTTTAFTSSGSLSGETIGSVTITASGGTAADAAAGSYDLTPSAATGGTFNPNNYTITYHNGALTVNNVALSVSATGDNKVYGQTRT